MRLATVDDMDALRDVYRRASLSNEGDRPLLEAHPELLELDEDGVREGRTIAATEHDAVVGFARVAHVADHLELEALFVGPEHRRSGHAARLVAAAADTARRSGVQRIEVNANDHARAFYEAMGFEEIGTARLQYGTAPRMVLLV